MKRHLFWLLGAWLLLAGSNVEAKMDTVSFTTSIDRGGSLYYFFRGKDSTEIEYYAVSRYSNNIIDSSRERLAPGTWYARDIDEDCMLKVRLYSSNVPRDIKIQRRYSLETEDTAYDMSISIIHNSSSTYLSEIDVSGCSSLASLSCYGDSLKSLDVSGLTALTNLYCRSKALTSLNVNGCTSLMNLQCYSGKCLASLDVSGGTALKRLSGYSENSKLWVGTLKIHGVSMDTLVIRDCRIGVLDASGCTSLMSLNCSSNSLGSLDVHGCTSLTSLNCSNNSESYSGLRSLDVSSCTSLTSLNCSGNRLTSLNVSGLTSLTSLDCSNNVYNPGGGYSVWGLTSLDVSSCTSLASLNCSHNSLTSLDVSGCKSLSRLDCRDNYYIKYTGRYSKGETPYRNEKTLTSLDVSGLTTLTSLDCSSNALTSLDVSGLTALTRLDCISDSLTNLDARGCTSLKTLNYNSGNLRSLDVSGCTALTDLSCYSNHLTSLDVSGCTALRSLDCRHNSLSEFDISTNTALTSLDCSYNSLTEFDISTNTALTSLDCYGNRLHIPLSQMYEIYTRTTWKKFNMGYQSDSIMLLLNEPWDLSTERIIGQITTDYKLKDAYDREVSADFWEENRFVFQFHEPLRYTLTLQNPNLENSHYDYYYDNNKNITFIWHISVVEELPVNYFTIKVTSNNTEWGTATVLGNGTYEEGKTVTITAKPKDGYRFVNWTKKDGAEFNKEAVHTFTVTENLELTANFEKLPDDVANENRQDDNFSLYVQDRTICLSENVGAVQVYNVAGQCVYSGVSTAIPVRHSGVYIVKVGTRSYKVVVR